MQTVTLSLGQYLVIAALIMITSLSITFRKMVRKRLASFARREPPQIENVTQSNVDMPGAIQGAAQILEEIGFKLYAVSETYLPHLNVTGITWHYINSEQGINTELIRRANRAVVQFTTWYNDDTLVETSYPIGENFNVEDYRSHFTQKSIPDAYAIQQAQMRKFSEEKSREPNPSHSLDMHIERERIYQQKYKSYKFMPGLLRGLGRFLTFNLAVVMALILAAVFVVPSLQVDDLKLFGKFATTVIGLAGSGFLYLKRKDRYHTGR